MKRNLKVLSTGALALALTVSLAACGEGESNTGGDGTYGSVSDYLNQDRSSQESYSTYYADGTKDKDFVSMYEAINHTVNEMDTDSFVVVKGGDLNKKLFVNYTQFAEDTKDMFWYYSGGNKLVEYTAWRDTILSDLRAHGDVSVVYKESGSGELQSYTQSFQVEKIAQNSSVTPIVPAGTVNGWNLDPGIETSVGVDLAPYSGIQKVDYSINLKDAQIAPSLNKADKTYALLGFKTADSYHNSNFGIACDTSTGNWYYYSGEIGDITVDTSKVVMTSTWNTSGYFVPNNNLDISAEIVLLDGDLTGDIVHRLNVKLDDNTTFTKDYEIAGISSDSTLRFVTGLDIVSENGLGDFANGSYFKNVQVTSAKGTVTQDALDGLTYMNMPCIETAGVYDLLNSNTQTDGRFHTIVYNPAYVTTNYATAGKDVYSFEYNVGEASILESVDKVIDQLAAISLIADIGESNRADVIAARAELAKLGEYQATIVSPALVRALEAAETKLGITV